MLLILNWHPSIICLMDIMRKGHIAWSATQVWERLWVGGLTDAEELAAGNPHGITTVVSLSEVPVEAKRASINYLHFPIEDEKPVSVRQFDRILDAMSENIRWGTVLLHCGTGISRAPSMAAAYMDAVGYRNFGAALREIRRVRTFVSPSDNLLDSIGRHLR
jgi:protein-tyrosine phosphatase